MAIKIYKDIQNYDDELSVLSKLNYKFPLHNYFPRIREHGSEEGTHYIIMTLY